MRLRILGETNDERGRQLEGLTCTLLQRCGYLNIKANVISTGGHELDIRAEYQLPGLNGTQSLDVIGECKAHDSPIGTADWLKFLGKVLTEESRIHSEVHAILISLSGVNGNVKGAYDELKKHKRHITLISGEVLAEQIQKGFSLPAFSDVAKYIQASTTIPATEFSLMYYSGAVYWLVEFADAHFTVLFGSNPEKVAPANVVKLAEAHLAVSVFRNLQEEKEASFRRKLHRKIILEKLLKSEHPIGFDEFCKECSEDDGDVVILSIRSALDTLLLDKLVEFEHGYFKLIDIRSNLKNRLNFLRELTGGFQPVTLFLEQRFIALIDADLLKIISEVQAGVPIPEIYHAEILQLLRWSPSALSWILRPDPMIVNHRIPPQNIHLDDDDLRYIRVILIRYVLFDYRSAHFKELYFESGLLEVENIQRVLFKGVDGCHIATEVAERLGVSRTAEGLGDGLTHLWLTQHAPEPMNRVKPENPPSNRHKADGAELRDGEALRNVDAGRVPG